MDHALILLFHDALLHEREHRARISFCESISIYTKRPGADTSRDLLARPKNQPRANLQVFCPLVLHRVVDSGNSQHSLVWMALNNIDHLAVALQHVQ